MRYIIFILILSCESVFAQPLYDSKRDYVWYLGTDTGNPGTNTGGVVNFNTNPPNYSLNQRPFNLEQLDNSICSSEGRMLFYTNGLMVSDSTNHIMPTGDSLNVGSDWTSFFWTSFYAYRYYQTAMTFPMPGNNTSYVIVHQRLSNLSESMYAKLLYSVVDMKENNGNGDIVSLNNSLRSDSLAFGYMSATRHANGRDWWILVSKKNNPDILKYLLSPSGLQYKGSQHFGYISANYGLAVFSPDGNYFSRFNFVELDSAVSIPIEVYHFDRCTGELYGLQDLTFNPGNSFYGGVAISPNSRYLYLTTWYQVYQWDLSVQNVSSTRQLVAQWDGFYDTWMGYQVVPGFGTCQLAPDGKIYISTLGTHYLNVIENPNLAGTACDICQHCIHFSSYEFNVPSFPNFRLGPVLGSICDSLAMGIEDPESSKTSITAYPNPATSDLTFDVSSEDYSSHKYLEIYTATGELVTKVPVSPYQSIVRYDVTALAKGMYMAILKSETQTIANCKFVVER